MLVRLLSYETIPYKHGETTDNSDSVKIACYMFQSTNVCVYFVYADKIDKRINCQCRQNNTQAVKTVRYTIANFCVI